MLRSLIMALPLALGLAANASAANFSFSYQTSQGLIEVDLVGDLQPDNNTFIVSGLTSVMLGGSFAFPATFVGSSDVAILGEPQGLSGSIAALVTLDGSAMDISICEDASCFDGFQISAGNLVEGFFGFGYPIVSASGNAGDVFEPFTVGRSTFTAETDAVAVPAPGGVALFGLALVGFGLATRRRA
ncbi:hypothetical protein [Falsiroseomonas sp.]|uniref:hypothetical protein n=1 Tax=Falsiroseomonas sp. TaxID=2870721 RepID=UPI003564D301